MEKTADYKDNLIDLNNPAIKAVLPLLLCDKTTGHNIIWATNSYSDHGVGYDERDEITMISLNGLDNMELQPRVYKSLEAQKKRTKSKAEVFTPSWICNLMNNHVNEQWFKRPDVFNVMDENHNWKSKNGKIGFKELKHTWQDYVYLRVIEITCGEAPYLVSRYDTVTGEPIRISKRIGMLDRKLRVVNENTTTEDEWFTWVKKAYQSTYGYEWQGDNLLIARINMLLTFIDYMKYKWDREPTLNELKEISKIIVWNIFQMDGLTYEIPLGGPVSSVQISIDDENVVVNKSNYVVIKNWRNGKSALHVPFNELTNKERRGHMKFDFCIGNPPYQAEKGNKKLYPYFYTSAIQIADCVEMIFPTAWQEPRTANGLQLMNKPEIKEDKRIVFIDNRQNVFPGVAGAEWTNIILWNSKHDNMLDGQQLIYENGQKQEIKKLLQNNYEISKPTELLTLYNCVNKDNFVSLQSATSVRKPYGLTTDVADYWKNYGIGEVFKTQQNPSDLKLICSNQTCYVPHDYKFPRTSIAKTAFKVLVPNAWGNLSKEYIGGAYANIIVAEPNEVCSETYLESGCFETREKANYHAKYLMTRFCRALLFLNKYSILCSKAWGAVPLQDYSEEWWNLSIEEIDEKLMDKYNVPQNIRDFVKENIQTKSEENIVNYKISKEDSNEEND